MKKITTLFYAALAVLTVASCSKQEMPVNETTQSLTREITCSLSATKTSIDGEGKTLWTRGDKVWFSDGTNSEIVTVADEFDGRQTCKFTLSNAQLISASKIYAVYPSTAQNGVSSGVVNFKIPAEQDGTFANANISTGVTEGSDLQFNNVAAILKFTVPEHVAYVKFVNGTTITKVNTAGNAGTYYAAVAPGTYAAGFKVIATSDNSLASQEVVTSADKLIAVNDLLNIGTIGSAMIEIGGSGTASEPYELSNSAHLEALSASVSGGNNMAGKYFKVMNNISGVITPIGAYVGETDFHFRGDFDGNNKTITLNINGIKYCGLFGNVGAGANIHDLVLEGSVISSEGTSAALAGCVNAGTDGAAIKNITNNATVSSTGLRVGGIVGYIDGSATIKDCVNNGKVSVSSYGVGGIVGFSNGSQTYPISLVDCRNTAEIGGTYSVGGLVGEAIWTTITRTFDNLNFSNSGKITGTAAGPLEIYGSAGGVVGSTRNANIIDSANSGDIVGVKNVGGIAGTLYWTNIEGSANAGKVSGVSQLGGISGNIYNRGQVTDCRNYAEIASSSSACGGIVGAILKPKGSFTSTFNMCYNQGPITGTFWVGGIVGYFNASANVDTGSLKIMNCDNAGTITATRNDKDGGEVAGGIIGGSYGVYGSLSVYNSLNTGNVYYSVASHKALYIGGIIGRLQNGTVENCYNSGEVKLKSGTPTPGYLDRLGAIAGSPEGSTTIKNCYYLTTATSQPKGTHASLTGTATDVIGTNDGVSLASSVTVGSYTGTNVVEALNAYAYEIYTPWIAGPKLASD